MAITVTERIGSNQQLGAFKVKILNVTAGASDTAMAVTKALTGLTNVAFASYSPSTDDNHGIVYLNFSDAGSTASNGAVYIDSVANSNTGSLFIIGV